MATKLNVKSHLFNQKDILDVEPNIAKSEDLESKQDKLVSGTNIKTINNESVLGGGNISISGGTQLYRHTILLSFIDYEDTQYNFKIVCVTNSNSNVGGYMKYLDNVVSLIQVNDLNEEQVLFGTELKYNEEGTFGFIGIDNNSVSYEVQTILSETETIVDL